MRAFPTCSRALLLPLIGAGVHMEALIELIKVSISSSVGFLHAFSLEGWFFNAGAISVRFFSMLIDQPSEM